MTAFTYDSLPEYIDKISAMFTPPEAPNYHIIEVFRPTKRNPVSASAFEKPSLDEATTFAEQANHRRKHYQGGETMLRLAILAPDGSLTDVYRYTPR